MFKSDERMNPTLPQRCKAMSRESLAGEKVSLNRSLSIGEQVHPPVRPV